MKIFSLLVWFSSTIHLSLLVSKVSYKPLILCTIFLFLSFSTSLLTPFICEIFLDWICQHWLLYDKLSSNNNNNNNHHVSVIQVCISELTTYRALILYNTYIVILVLMNISVNSVLFVDQQQLAWYTYSSQQWSFLLCSVTMFCLYRTVSHQLRWELISHHTLMQFWFKVKVCWFLSVVLTVKNVIWHSFWNVIVHQNISVSVVTTVSDMIMLLTALYTTMMCSLSSQTMRITTVSMRVSALLNWDELHQLCCWQEWSLLTLIFKYIQLLFLFLCCL